MNYPSSWRMTSVNTKGYKLVPEEGTVEDVEVNSRKLQWVANKKHCNSSKRIALVLAHLV